MSKNEIVLGLDVGSRRIGVARGNSLVRLAAPLTILPADDQDQVVVQLRQLIDNEKADRLVVGLPRSLDGNETDQTKAVREFVETNLKGLGLPIEFQDEAGTSHEAATRMQSSGSKFTYDDAHAAAIILQDYLDNL